jgi:hypothetical protein
MFFQPEGYIFLGFHPLTYHKPLHFDGFCFILPLQILNNLLAHRLAPCGAARVPRGRSHLKKLHIYGSWEFFFLQPWLPKKAQNFISVL